MRKKEIVKLRILYLSGVYDSISFYILSRNKKKERIERMEKKLINQKSRSPDWNSE